MRARAIGLGAGILGLGAYIVAARAAGARLSTRGPPQLPKSASGPGEPLATESPLPGELAQRLFETLADLTVTPTPETVAGAVLFADQLAQAGYVQSATALRATIARVTADAQPSPTSPSSMGDAKSLPDLVEPEEPAEKPTVLWTDHYLGGWQQTDATIQMVVREALDHLGSDATGYITHRPSEWDTLQAGESAAELARLGVPTLADGLRELVAESQTLPEPEP